MNPARVISGTHTTADPSSNDASLSLEAASAPPIALLSIEVAGFRNLATQTIDLHPRFNILAGDNGQGKTNTLEAIYLLATSRSFRTALLTDCIGHLAARTSVRGRLADERDLVALEREQSIEITGGRRVVRINGKRPRSLAAFALETPVVLFEPSSLLLTQGGASERRRLLDRVALHAAARAGGLDALMHDLDAYRRAHASRRKALDAGAAARVLDAYERLMADHGSRVMRSRAAAATALAAQAVRAFESIGRIEQRLDLGYLPRGPTEPEALARSFAERRREDARRRTATMGPHLDDLAIRMGSYPVRRVASQGQHRAIVLSLKAAELRSVALARGVQPILLLDDVSSELDPTRNGALFRFLGEHVGQVVLTTTRASLIELDDPGFRRFDVREGRVLPTDRS